MTDLRLWFKLTYSRMVFPDHSDLYSDFVTKLFRAESPINCAKWFLLTYFLCFLP